MPLNVNKRQPELCADIECTGCAGCFNACPTDAISMHQSYEGFYRPMIDADKCVSCLRCERACPVITPYTNDTNKQPRLYAAWHRDPSIRRDSSSGGAFTALAQAVLGQNGKVYGAAYDETLHIHHRGVSSESELKSLRLSKYAQSEIGGIYRDIQEDLIKGTQVLFCGTPCQCAALRKLVPDNVDNLVIVDFVCHGVPSPKMLKAYKDWLEYNELPEIAGINFRDKSKGWYDALRVTCDKSGKKAKMKGIRDNYWIGFNDNKNLQEACYNCHFLGSKRNTDITIADFWGLGHRLHFHPGQEVEKGVSAIMVSTDRGARLFENAAKSMELQPREFNEFIDGNAAMIRPSHRPRNRNTFYFDLHNLPYDDMIKRHLRPSFKARLVKIFRERFPRWFVIGIRNFSQK